MPEHQPLRTNDIAGLLLIMLGLFVYRFVASAAADESTKANISPTAADLKKALIHHDGDDDDDEVECV